jgi:hypothetical protein
MSLQLVKGQDILTWFKKRMISLVQLTITYCNKLKIGKTRPIPQGTINWLEDHKISQHNSIME